MLGYGKASKTMTLEAHAVATGVIALTTDPIEIEGLTVTTSAQIQRLRDVGYYNREQLGFGHQIGPLEIASTNATQPADYFYRIPSVDVVSEAFGRKHVESRRSCATLSSFGLSNGPTTFGGSGKKSGAGSFVPAAGPNTLAVYLDGVRYRDSFDRIPINTIEAMEVYVGSHVPMQFSEGIGGARGVILIWSRW
jgi:hypothetical protein